MAQASVRFALDNEDVSTVLVGYSDEGQIEAAAAASAMPSFDEARHKRLEGLWASDFGLAGEKQGAG